MTNVFISIQNRVHFQRIFDYMNQSDKYSISAVVDPLSSIDFTNSGIDVFDSDSIRHLGYFNGENSKELLDYYDELSFMLRRFINSGFVSEYSKIDFIEKTVGFWSDWLKKNNIELILFHAIPHELWDYIVYLLAKKNKIKTVIIEKTFWPDRVIITSEFRKNLTDVNICNDIYPYPLKKITKEIHRVDLQLAPYWTRNKFKGYKEKFKDRVIRVLKTRKLFLADRIKYVRRMNSYSGFYGNNFYTKNDLKNKNMLWHMFWRYKIFYKRMLLITEKENQAHKFIGDISDKYIIFFLQVQPEKNTSPQGGEFYDQIDTIRKIKSWLPDEIDILVREHPSQYKRWQSPHKGRDVGFYSTINKIGAKFICNSIDKKYLVDNSIGVITVAGSVALESFMRGANSAYMGYPWYSGIKGIHCIRSKEDLINFINHNNINNVEYIENSLMDFMKNTVPGFFERYNEKGYRKYEKDWSYNIFKSIDHYNLDT